MTHVTYGFLVTTLAGLSTMIGALFIFFFPSKQDTIIVRALSFAAGVMVTISLTDLIPEGKDLLMATFYSIPDWLICFIFVVIGVIISMLIDRYIPDSTNTNTTSSKNLYRVGIISMVAIILHNVPEGIATFMATNKDMALGISLAIAIALHNIPEGISISIPIYFSSGSKIKAIFYTFISGISELLGAILACLFLAAFMTDTIMGVLFSIIAGIMLHISFYELLPTAHSYHKQATMRLFFLVGVGFMLINHFFL